MFYPLAHKSIDIVSFLIHRMHGIYLVVLLKAPRLAVYCGFSIVLGNQAQACNYEPYGPSTGGHLTKH